MVLVCYLTLLIMHLFTGLNRRAASLLLVCLRTIVRLSMTTLRRTGNQAMSPTSPPLIYKDPCSVINQFDMEPWTQSYVCCPECFALYDSPCPFRCTYRATPMRDEINHFLTLIVDELLPFWNPSVTFTRTAKFPQGHLIHVVLIPYICDSPAAKQVAGFAGHSATCFCFYFLLQLEDIKNIDQSTWERWDYTSHMRHAQAWRDAESVAERVALWRNMCTMERTLAQAFLHSGTQWQLESCRKHNILYFLCLERDLRWAGTCRQMAKALMKWASIYIFICIFSHC